MSDLGLSDILPDSGLEIAAATASGLRRLICSRTQSIVLTPMPLPRALHIPKRNFFPRRTSPRASSCSYAISSNVGRGVLCNPTCKPILVPRNKRSRRRS